MCIYTLNKSVVKIMFSFCLRVSTCPYSWGNWSCVAESCRSVCWYEAAERYLCFRQYCSVYLCRKLSRV